MHLHAIAQKWSIFATLSNNWEYTLYTLNYCCILYKYRFGNCIFNESLYSRRNVLNICDRAMREKTNYYSGDSLTCGRERFFLSLISYLCVRSEIWWWRSTLPLNFFLFYKRELMLLKVRTMQTLPTLDSSQESRHVPSVKYFLGRTIIKKSFLKDETPTLRNFHKGRKIVKVT